MADSRYCRCRARQMTMPRQTQLLEGAGKCRMTSIHSKRIGCHFRQIATSKKTRASLSNLKACICGITRVVRLSMDHPLCFVHRLAMAAAKLPKLFTSKCWPMTIRHISSLATQVHLILPSVFAGFFPISSTMYFSPIQGPNQLRPRSRSFWPTSVPQVKHSGTG